MGILLGILKIIGLFIVLVASLLLCKEFVFSKVRINKYIPLAISIAILLVQLALPFFEIHLNFWVTAIFSVLIVVTFFWFMDIHQTGGPKPKEKKIVIKSKAKPNRVKNNKK